MSFKKKTKASISNTKRKNEFSVFINKTENFTLYSKKSIKNVSIPKRVVKKANKRNKLRRRIKEILRTSNSIDNKNYIIKVKCNLINKTFNQMSNEIQILIGSHKIEMS